MKQETNATGVRVSDFGFALFFGVGEATKTVYSVASKQLLIFAPPALLTLHLKRFTQNGMTLKKVRDRRVKL